MIERKFHENTVCELLGDYPVVALLGARQVGKTTLANVIARNWKDETHRFDLESTADLARLADAELALSALKGLVILDEIHRRPEIFPTLRVLADRTSSDTKFLVLGSASTALLKQSSESLAGRVAYYELPGLLLSEVDNDEFASLWLKGGFPKSFTTPGLPKSFRWRGNFIRSFLERDIPQFGISISSVTLERFWTMLAHYHGQLWNSSEIGRAFGVSHTTVNRYLDILESTFMLRRLSPWRANISKRQMKSPKIYVLDSGLLHQLLDIANFEDLERHPKIGASWEGFIIENIINAFEIPRHQCHFWATHTGAEIDLVLRCDGELRGFEIKRTSQPSVTPSMRSALENLQLSRIDVVHAGDNSFALGKNIRAIAASRLLLDL